jgi:hypothetical protein
MGDWWRKRGVIYYMKKGFLQSTIFESYFELSLWIILIDFLPDLGIPKPFPGNL